MPYYITDKAQDCSGWAVTKEDGEVIGCHMTKQGAIDQMVAVSVAEDMEPGGELESRAVDMTPPVYMRAAARRGLEYFEEGKGGDGLVDQTIADARSMASGEVSERKWRLIGPWIARHLVDLDSPSAQPDSPEYPSAGVVAMLLWGAPANRRGAERAQAYAEGVVARLDAEQERKASMTNRETRDFETQFEIREEGDGMTFVGYAAKFDQPSENLGGFVEYVERGAFSRSLKSRNDVMLLWNHDAGQPLASTRSGTMKLTEDDIGLRVEARLPQTTLGKDLAILLRDGIVGKMSFGFNVIKDSWNSEGNERRLKSVRLFEVSAVVWPAYTQTSAAVRGLDKVALRASVDADELADVMLKIEEGADLTPDQAELMKSVVERLAPAPAPEEAVTEEPQPSLLAVKQKQLDLLLKRI
jgi:HK97 family phage prohead protease